MDEKMDLAEFSKQVNYLALTYGHIIDSSDDVIQYYNASGNASEYLFRRKRHASRSVTLLPLSMNRDGLFAEIEIHRSDRSAINIYESMRNSRDTIRQQEATTYVLTYVLADRFVYSLFRGCTYDINAERIYILNEFKAGAILVSLSLSSSDSLLFTSDTL